MSDDMKALTPQERQPMLTRIAELEAACQMAADVILGMDAQAISGSGRLTYEQAKAWALAHPSAVVLHLREVIAHTHKTTP